MKMDEFDKMLSYALKAEEIPGDELNEQLLEKARERGQYMKQDEKHIDHENGDICKRKKEDRRAAGRMKRFPAAAVIAAAVLCIGSLSAVAAWKYLLPQQVAEVQSERLAEAFAGEDAITVNEVQEIGDYRITFLGVVSGRGLTECGDLSDQRIAADSTYTVVAIERLDGTPMADTSSEDYGETDFFITPAIKGYDPVWYNAITLSDGENGSAGYMDMVEQGVLYRLSECHTMEIFADRELYLLVSESTFYDNQAYIFDEESGELSRNPEYAKVNALFSLPLDPAKADPTEAGRILAMVDVPDRAEMESCNADVRDDELPEESCGQSGANGGLYAYPLTEEEKEARIREAVLMQVDAARAVSPSELTQAEIDEITDKVTKVETFVMDFETLMAGRGESIDSMADCVEDTLQVLSPDEEGNICYCYSMDDGRTASVIFSLNDVYERYPDFHWGFLPGGVSYSYSEGMEDLMIDVVWINEDRTVTFAVYEPKEEYK